MTLCSDRVFLPRKNVVSNHAQPLLPGHVFCKSLLFLSVISLFPILFFSFLDATCNVSHVNHQLRHLNRRSRPMENWQNNELRIAIIKEGCKSFLLPAALVIAQRVYKSWPVQRANATPPATLPRTTTHTCQTLPKASAARRTVPGVWKLGSLIILPHHLRRITCLSFSFCKVMHSTFVPLLARKKKR